MADAATGPHLSDAELGALIYSVGQNRDLERRAYSHIASCAECTQRLGAMRESDRDIDRLLSTLDVPVPARSVDSVIQTARMHRVGSNGSWRRAAATVAFLVVAGGVAAAAIPASPVHQVLVDFFGSRSVGSLHVNAEPSPAARESVSPAVSFLVSPRASLDVAFDGAGVGGSIEVKVVDGDQVSLSSPTSGATYRVSTNRIAVDQQSPAQFQLEIPRSLGELRVRVGGRVVYENGGSAISHNFTLQLTRPDAKRR